MSWISSKTGKTDKSTVFPSFSSRFVSLGIAQKLSCFFFVFILIFSGTVADIFLKVRQMSRTSDRIVAVNNQVAVLGKNMRESLIDMDASIKKFKLLKRTVYFQYFDTARNAYNRDLNRIIFLTSMGRPTIWTALKAEFDSLTGQKTEEELAGLSAPWIKERQLSHWISAISRSLKTNQKDTDQAMIHINAISRRAIRNAGIGFGISILVTVLGTIFISRSIIRPLNRLRNGLKEVADDNYAHVIPVRSGDEFGQLSAAFNTMSRQLKADEDIRTDFIATLSHEIRTPLSSIRESVNMISEEVLGPVNEKQKKFLTIAGQEITRITRLLNHLLDASALTAKETLRTSMPLDPNTLTDNTVQALQATAAARQITLLNHPLDRAPKVMGDEKEIYQVLNNLIGNALKFSPGGSQVDINLAPQGKRMLAFYISDQGPGIPEDKQSLIFKKYFRDESVRKHMDGVGLGLNIARGIVHAHGGQIHVKNNPGPGCTFSFTLPVHSPRRKKEHT